MNLADTGSGLRSDTVQAEEAFRRSIDSLSRLLASRPVDPPPPLPDVDLFAREEVRARRRLATAALLLVAAIAVVSAGIYSFLHGASPPQSPRIELVAAVVPPPPAPVKPVAPISTIVPLPVDPAPVSAAELLPLPVPVSQPLDARGISELQTRLGNMGFSPGPVDGVAGPKTVAAIKRYQQAGARAQTGAVDTEVLDQLRKEALR